MKRLLLYMAFFLSPLVALGASDDGGTESPFMFGTGARELSLGGACLTTADASTAVFWNPARLAPAQRLSLGGLHSRLYDSDVAYQYLGLAIPTVDWGCFGIGVFRLGVDGIEQRDVNNFLLGEIEDTRLGFYVGYGHEASNFDLGVTATMEHHSIGEYKVTSSPGLNIAAGRTWDFASTVVENISAVLTVRNVISPEMKLVESEVTQPLTFNAAGSVKLAPNRAWNHDFELSVAMIKVENIDARFCAGLEYSARDLLRLRGGVNRGNLSLGVGIQYRSFGFDYALVDRDMGSVHMFSLTSTFGTPLSEQKHQRAFRREQEFNRTMSSRLEERNRQMMSELTDQGKAAAEAGDLVEARNSLDRALFLARNLAADTLEILALAGQVEQRLEESLRKQRYRQYVDSAQARLDADDFIGARYFASQALGEYENSPEGARILRQADTALESLASQKEVVDSRLWQIDSLLSYGDFDQAATIARTLAQFARDDERVKQALKKAEFERIRNIASVAYTSGDLQGALAAVDSALVLFPGHNTCISLRKQINRDMTRISKPIPETQSTGRPPLTTEMKKEVEATYITAQRLFEAGDLDQAILHWEKVVQLAGDYQSVRQYLINGYKFVGVELYSQNKLKEAVATWKKAAQLDADNDEINEYIKRTENEIRRLEELSYERQ